MFYGMYVDGQELCQQFQYWPSLAIAWALLYSRPRPSKPVKGVWASSEVWLQSPTLLWKFSYTSCTQAGEQSLISQSRQDDRKP